jgi:hypothetical protein
VSASTCKPLIIAGRSSRAIDQPDRPRSTIEESLTWNGKIITGAFRRQTSHTGLVSSSVRATTSAGSRDGQPAELDVLGAPGCQGVADVGVHCSPLPLSDSARAVGR